MKTDLHISKRLQALLPPQSDEARKRLEENIVKDGRILDPILYWNDGKRNVVIDGMTRWEIRQKHGIEKFQTVEVTTCGNTYEEVAEWIWDHQAGRRNLSREDIGRWYNNLKAARGGDKQTKVSNDTLVAAKKVSEKTGVSESTVKRAGARVEAIESLSKPAQKVAQDATDSEVKALAKLDEAGQGEVARAIRTGQASSVKEAIKLTGAKPAKEDKPKRGKPPTKPTRTQWFKQWEKAIGPVVRLVDKIANEVGEPKCQSKLVVHDHLNVATEEMMEWMGVEEK
jgi:hypothetical protein